MLSLLPYAVIAVMGGFMLSQMGERAEDRRRRIGNAADWLKEKGAPGSFTAIFDEFRVADKSGGVKAIYDFVTMLTRDPEQREALFVQWQERMLDDALADPDRREKIGKKMDKLRQVDSLEDQETYERVKAEKESAVTKS